MLEDADGAVTPIHERCHFRRRKANEEAIDEDVMLVTRKLLERLDELLALGDGFHGLLGAWLGAHPVGDGVETDGWMRRSIVVDDRVASYRGTSGIPAAIKAAPAGSRQTRGIRPARRCRAARRGRRRRRRAAGWGAGVARPARLELTAFRSAT